MSTVGRGLVAGLVATVVLVLVIMLRRALGVFADVNVIPMISAAASELFSLPRTGTMGWLLLFVIGGVWGLVFGWIYTRIAGRSGLVRGLIFAAAAWVVMMLVFMPVAGMGWFGLAGGAWTPVVALVMHLIFGAAMGLCFEALARDSPGQGV